MTEEFRNIIAQRIAAAIVADMGRGDKLKESLANEIAGSPAAARVLRRILDCGVSALARDRRLGQLQVHTNHSLAKERTTQWIAQLNKEHTDGQSKP